MTETFALLLRRFRVRQGLTKSDLAAALGAGRTSVVAWEAGRRVPRDRARLLDIAQVLRLSPDETEQLIAAARHQRLRSGDLAAPALRVACPGPPAPLVLPQHTRPAVADFVGRAAETMQLLAVLQMVETPGHGTVVGAVRGMGGIGKTELAYHVADRLRATFPDAQIVLDLRGSSTTPLAATQALQIVIRAFTPDAQLPDELAALEWHYRAVLHGRRVLILADDAADATQVRPLLPPRGSALLITSRQRFTLPGMVAVDLGELGEAEAITLLRGICARLTPDAAQAITRANAGLPLALRVSASILHNDPALAIDTYIAQLADEQQRLARLRDPDDPHLDVAASLALSYVRLDASTQAVFRQIGALAADFTTELAQAVVEVPAGEDVATTLHLLLRRSLIMHDGERGRWWLHDLVGDLARSYLLEAAAWVPTMWRYAQAIVRMAQAAQAQYEAGGSAALAALAWFDAERVHLNTIRDWAATQAGTPAGDRLLLDIALATVHIGALRYDARHERLPLWQRALAAAQRLSDQGAAGLALNQLGNALMVLGDVRRAIPYYEQRLTLARAIGDRHGQGVTLCNLGLAYADLGDFQRAIELYEQDLVIVRELGDRRGEGQTLGNLGLAYANLGDTRRAIKLYEQNLAIIRELGDRRGEGQILGNLGNAYADLGDFQRAIECCEVACMITRAIGDQRLEGYALSYLAHALAQRGDHAHAMAAFWQAVALLREVGDRAGAAACQWQFGLVLAQQGVRARALPLLRAGLAYKQEIGHTQAPAHAALLAQIMAEVDAPGTDSPTAERSVGQWKNKPGNRSRSG